MCGNAHFEIVAVMDCVREYILESDMYLYTMKIGNAELKRIIIKKINKPVVYKKNETKKPNTNLTNTVK